MAASLPLPFDCCVDVACKTTSITIVQTVGALAAVDTLADLRAIPSTVRVNNAVIQVLGEFSPLSGDGWQSVWRASDMTDDAPPNSTRPNDVDALSPGRWRQTI